MKIHKENLIGTILKCCEHCNRARNHKRVDFGLYECITCGKVRD